MVIKLIKSIISCEERIVQLYYRFLPFRYCDTLHRAALHLGKWVKVEGRACHLPSHV